MFLADLGRGTIVVAVLGPAAVSCSSGNGGSSAGDSGATTDATSLAPPTTPSPTSSSPATSAAATSAPTSAAATDALAPVTYHRVSLGFVSAYLLVRGNEAAVVDTGVDGSVDEIQGALDAASVGWDAVGHVILTHHHPDHVGSLSAVLDAATGATAYAGEPDIAQITSPRPLRAVGDGDEVFGLQVIATPGHTPGHIAVLDPAERGCSWPATPSTARADPASRAPTRASATTWRRPPSRCGSWRASLSTPSCSAMPTRSTRAPVPCSISSRHSPSPRGMLGR